MILFPLNKTKTQCPSPWVVMDDIGQWECSSRWPLRRAFDEAFLLQRLSDIGFFFPISLWREDAACDIVSKAGTAPGGGGEFVWFVDVLSAGTFWRVCQKHIRFYPLLTREFLSGTWCETPLVAGSGITIHLAGICRMFVKSKLWLGQSHYVK